MPDRLRKSEPTGYWAEARTAAIVRGPEVYPL